MAGELATSGQVHPESPLAASAGEATGALEQVIITGDLAKLTPEQRLQYYGAICRATGLNPLARPFEYLNLKGKLVLYATKSCTDQLRSGRGISTRIGDARLVDGVYVVTATAFDRQGREEVSTGAVAVEGLKGEERANAMMKAETKAKRRATLSFTGLGLLDETEVEGLADADRVAQRPAARQATAEQTALPAANPKPTSQPAAKPPKRPLAVESCLALLDKLVAVGVDETAIDNWLSDQGLMGRAAVAQLPPQDAVALSQVLEQWLAQERQDRAEQQAAAA
jgi:hypothetical protein